MADVNKRILITTEFKTQGKVLSKGTANVFKSFVRFGKGINSTFGKTFRVLRKVWFQLFRFRAEMLSTLFFGMALQRFFTGLLKPALEMAGIFEIISTILQLFFLPIALALIDPLLVLMDAILNISDSTKLWIGKLVLIGAALGTAMFLVGVFSLGIMGLITAIATFALKAGIFFLLLEVLEALGFNVKQNLKNAFDSLVETLDILWDRFIDSAPVQKFLENLGLTKDEIKKLKNPISFIKEKLKKMWDGIKTKWGEEIAEIKTLLIERFKDFLLALTGIETWDELIDKWENFKTNAILAIQAVSTAWDAIANLKLSDDIKAVMNWAGPIIGAVVGAKLGGAAGAVVGFGAGFALAPPSWLRDWMTDNISTLTAINQNIQAGGEPLPLQPIGEGGPTPGGKIGADTTDLEHLGVDTKLG